MTIVALSNTKRDDSQIFYIRKYSSTAVVQLPRSQENVNINFSIEMNGLGSKTINLNLLNSIDYPLIPLKKAIIDYINKCDEEGQLDCSSL